MNDCVLRRVEKPQPDVIQREIKCLSTRSPLAMTTRAEYRHANRLREVDETQAMFNVMAELIVDEFPPPQPVAPGQPALPEGFLPQEIQNIIFAINARRDFVAERQAADEEFANTPVFQTYNFIMNFFDAAAIQNFAEQISSGLAAEDIAEAFVQALEEEEGGVDADLDELDLPEDFDRDYAVNLIVEILQEDPQMV